MAKILILEDDRSLRKAIRGILESAGHEVLEAEDGEAGLRLFRETPADLVITDLIMPKKEGIETILELRDKYSDSLKIIAMSGGGLGDPEKYLRTAKTLGADLALVKPISRKVLLDAVDDVLGRS